MTNKTFAQQATSYRELKRIKAIGHPAREGFEQHYNHTDGKYAGYIATVNNFGISYRSYPAKAGTGRLFDKFDDALDHLLTGGNSSLLARQCSKCHQEIGFGLFAHELECNGEAK